MIFLRLATYCVFVVTLTGWLNASALTQPQPPTPGPLAGGRAQEEQPEREAEVAPGTRASGPTGSANAFGDGERDQPDATQDPRHDWRDWLPNWIIAVLALVSAGVAYLQWRTTSTQAQIAQKQNEIVGAQNKILEGQNRLLGDQLAATEEQGATLDATLETNRVIERAYISISHHPPGVEIDDIAVTQAGEESFGGWHTAMFRFAITNEGNTPATITDISMNHCVGPSAITPAPPSGQGTGDHAFLVKGEKLHDERSFAIRHTDRDQLGVTLRLWMMGFVDYIDSFGERRRAGYARYYDPDKDSKGPYQTDMTSTLFE